MADNHTKEQRSTNMSHIRSTDTRPEVMVRKYLFKQGFRYRKNDDNLPGKPDIVLPKYHTVVFVNGCFWHKHNCSRFVWPSSNKVYWTNKILKNVERDQENQTALAAAGWKVIVIWECELKKKLFQETMEKVINEIKGGTGEWHV